MRHWIAPPAPPSSSATSRCFLVPRCAVAFGGCATAGLSASPEPTSWGGGHGEGRAMLHGSQAPRGPRAGRARSRVAALSRGHARRRQAAPVAASASDPSGRAIIMTAPAPEPHMPHIAYVDREAVLDEIGRLGWALQVHAEFEHYAGLDHPDGIDLAAKDAR